MSISTAQQFVSVPSFTFNSVCVTRFVVNFNRTMTWSSFIRLKLEKMAKVGSITHSTNLKFSTSLLTSSCINHRSKWKDIDNASPACLTGIVCELGPSSEESATLVSMIRNGMRIAKLNCSKASHEYNSKIIDCFRTAALKYREITGICLPFAVAIETSGSDIHTGALQSGLPDEVELKRGDAVKIVFTECLDEKFSSERFIYVICPKINKMLQKNSSISVDDGRILLTVKKHDGDVVECIVDKTGMLSSMMSVHLPGVTIDLSKKDEEDIQWGLKQGVDIIFVSLTETSDQLGAIKQIVDQGTNRVKVFAKIESLQGWKNIEGILDVADGIVIDRDALINKIEPQKLFSAQKAMVSSCNKIDKPVIVGGQILDSMVNTTRISWSESSDISSLVLDGADCIELSAGTAYGKYPKETVATLSAICAEAESAVQHNQLFLEFTNEVSGPLEANHAAAISAVKAAISSNARSIICITSRGDTALLLAKYSPPCPVVAVTRDPQVAKEMLFHRAIMPILYEEKSESDWTLDFDDCVRYGMKYGVTFNFLKSGDPVIVISRWEKSPGFTDSVRIKVECVDC